MDITLKPHRIETPFDEWSPAFTEKIAKDHSIELTDDHWHVLAIAREFYEETGISPDMRPLVKLLKTRGNPDLASSLELMRLFGGSPARAVAALAGLPKPVSCL